MAIQRKTSEQPAKRDAEWSPAGPPGGAAPTSLERLETTDDFRTAQWRYQRHAHRLVRRDRELIWLALSRADSGALRKRADRLLHCCRKAELRRTGFGEIRLCWHRCRDRICPRCADHRAQEAKRRTLAAVSRMDAPRFITLTLRSCNAPLAGQLGELRAAFRRLRQSPLWRRCVKGGIYTLEITRNESTGQWHPHLHILADGEYIPQADLSRAWLRATGDSPIVDIRAVHSRKAASRYIAKYVTKPHDVARWHPAAIAEYAASLAGSRTIATIGNLHGVALDPPDPNADLQKTEPLIALRDLDRLVRNGHPQVMHALNLLAWYIPELYALYPEAQPRPIDDSQGNPVDAMAVIAEALDPLQHDFYLRDTMDPAEAWERLNPKPGRDEVRPKKR